MRQYFERLEQCRYRATERPDRNPSRHGFDGWLVTLADPKLAVRDRQLLSVILRAALTSLGQERPTSSAESIICHPTEE